MTAVPRYVYVGYRYSNGTTVLYNTVLYCTVQQRARRKALSIVQLTHRHDHHSVLLC